MPVCLYFYHPDAGVVESFADCQALADIRGCNEGGVLNA